ncbi:PH domain-containing protein [Candidatus Uhrbacteria bacterium]|nr:PH domain-containing protein [Candidatus Uhrbacteria bacterium]
MTIADLIHRKPYEHQLLALRRHWIILARDLVVSMLLALFPVGMYFFLRANLPEFLTHPVAYPLLVLLASAYELGIWLFTLTQFLDYELDLWVVTNDRLVTIEQKGLFSRTVGELDLWRVQDVTTEVHGLFPTFFNYGDVHVQTAGAVERFVLEQVPNPGAIQKFILEMADVDRKFQKPSADATPPTATKTE